MKDMCESCGDKQVNYLCVCKETVVCEGCLKDHLASHHSKRTRIVAMQHPVLSVLIEGAHNVSDADEKYFNTRYEQTNSKATQEDVYQDLRKQMIQYLDEQIHHIKLNYQSHPAETVHDITKIKNTLREDIKRQLNSNLKNQMKHKDKKERINHSYIKDVSLDQQVSESSYFRENQDFTFKEPPKRFSSSKFLSSRSHYKESTKNLEEEEAMPYMSTKHDTSVTQSSYFPDCETVGVETPDRFKKLFQLSDIKNTLTLKDLLYSSGELIPSKITKETPREFLTSQASYTTKASDFRSSHLASTSERFLPKFVLSIPSSPSTSAHSFKIVLLGDHKSGKSELISTFIKDSFQYKPKLGLDFTTLKIPLDDLTVNLDIWDVKADTKFQYLAKSCYYGAKGAIIMFDMSEELSYYSVVGYLKEIFEESSPGCQIFIVGSKLDKLKKRQPSSLVSEIASLAVSEGAHYDEISCLNYQHVESLLRRISLEVYKSSIRL